QNRALDVVKLVRLHLVVDRVAWLRGPRPLRVQMRLRPKLVARNRDEPFEQELRRVQPALAVDALDVSRASTADLVHKVDGVALGEEILRPAVAPVRSAGKIRTAHGAARD